MEADGRVLEVDVQLGMGQNSTTRKPQVLVIVSIYQGSQNGYPFLTHTELAGLV